MIRFAKPDGSSFKLGYKGTIFAFDAGNDRIALCPGEWKIDDKEGIGEPARWG